MPENWKKYALGQVADLRKESVQPKDFQGEKYIGLEHMGQGNFLLNGIGRASDVTSNKFRFENGDILYGKIRPYFKKAYRPKFFGICSTDILIINSKSEEVVQQEYLYQLIKTQFFTDKAVETSTGTKMPRADWNSLQKMEFAFPSLEKQKAIASILSALDDKIELNLQMNKTLEEMAMSLYKHWFVDFGPFQDGEFVDSELGKIPKGWEISYFNEMLVLQRGFDLPQRKRVQGSHPVFAASGRSTSHLEKKVNGPGVVTGRSGVLGKVFLIHEDFWPLNTTLWVKEYPNSSPYHAYFLLSSLDLKEFNSGSAVPTLNRNDVHRQRIVKPPLDVIDQFDRKINYYFDLQQLNYLENQTLTSLRDTLLPKLISGEVRVKDAKKNLSEVL